MGRFDRRVLTGLETGHDVLTGLDDDVAVLNGRLVEGELSLQDVLLTGRLNVDDPLGLLRDPVQRAPGIADRTDRHHRHKGERDGNLEKDASIVDQFHSSRSTRISSATLLDCRP